MQAAGMIIICHHPKILCDPFLSFARVASSHFSLACARMSREVVSSKFRCQENSPNDFPSIIAACWWAVVTLTSLGQIRAHPKHGHCHNRTECERKVHGSCQLKIGV